MPLFAEQPLPNSIVLAVNLAILSCVAVWMWVVSRRSQHLPILPYQPRRPVPWGGIDVAAMAIVYLLGPSLLFVAAHHWFGISIGPELQAAEGASPDTIHPLARI